MLSAAFGCLQDASKSRDSGALAELLARLGVTSAADLAYVDDAATLSIKALLKPVAANYFAVAIGYALHAAKNECFAYDKFYICMRTCVRAHYAHIRARVMN